MVFTLPRCNTMLSPKIGLTNGSGLAAASGAFWAKARRLRCKQKCNRNDNDESVPVNHEWKNLNLLATCLKAKILAEKRHHVILEAISDLARVSAGINLEAVRDSILIEHIVQLGGIDSQSVLVADVDRDGAISAQISDVLIDESQRRIRRPFREDVRLRLRRLSSAGQDRAEDSSDRATMRRPRQAGRAGKNDSLAESSGVFTASSAFSISGFGRLAAATSNTGS